jgi:hypothetical protein
MQSVRDRQPEDVGSGAIDWVTGHDIYERYVREREAQEVQEGHEVDEGHEAKDDGEQNGQTTMAEHDPSRTRISVVTQWISGLLALFEIAPLVHYILTTKSLASVTFRFDLFEKKKTDQCLSRHFGRRNHYSDPPQRGQRGSYRQRLS